MGYVSDLVATPIPKKRVEAKASQTSANERHHSHGGEKSVMEIELDAGQANLLQITIDSGEVNANGQSNEKKIVLSYGYFRTGQEVLQEPAMKPDFRLENSQQIVLQQTPEQVSRARSAGAELRVALRLPSEMSFSQSRLENGTVSAKGIKGLEISLNSGTVQATLNHGAYKLSLISGTVTLSGVAAGFAHQIAVEAGTVTLAADSVLALVRAEVMQGVIQGDYQGRLERLGLSGWKLVPTEVDPHTSIECRVSTGTIMLRRIG